MSNSTNFIKSLTKESQSQHWQRFNPPTDVRNLFLENPNITIISTTDELIDYACGGPGSDYYEVSYDVQGFGKIVEAYVCRVRNGVCANFTSPYMRRRDADAIVIGDDDLADKITFREKYGYSFSIMRQKTFDWLKKQPLMVYGFIAGKPGMGLDAMLIAHPMLGFSLLV